MFVCWENLSDILKKQQNVQYSHATVHVHRSDRFREKLTKITLQERVRVEANER